MYKTDNLNELFTALAKAQSEMPIAGLNQQNPFFKSSYADLTELVRVSRPVLTKNGLSVIQIVIHDDNIKKEVLRTVLGHTSGQYITSQMTLNPTKPDPQSLASYLSYLKRYSYAAIVGVVASDEDDDAEIAMPRSNKLPERVEVVTKEQYDMLQQVLKDSPKLAKRMLDRHKIDSFEYYPKASFMADIKRAQELVAQGEK